VTGAHQGATSVLFDLDGTLIDSAPDVRAAINRALEDDGRRALSLDEVKGLVGEGAQVLIERALALTGTPGTKERVDDYLQRFVSAYAEHPAERTVIYPGVLETLETLASEGTRLGICTNKPQATTLLVLKALNLDRYFRIVTCGDSVPHRKPDGRHVTLTLEGMSGAPESAAFVGDSESDMAAARGAGISAIAVTYGYCRVPPNRLDADALIDDIRDLPETLHTIFLHRNSCTT